MSAYSKMLETLLYWTTAKAPSNTHPPCMRPSIACLTARVFEFGDQYHYIFDITQLLDVR